MHSFLGADSIELTERACLSVMYILRLLVPHSQLCASLVLKIAGRAARRPTATLRCNLPASNKGTHREGKREAYG